MAAIIGDVHDFERCVGLAEPREERSHPIEIELPVVVGSDERPLKVDAGVEPI
jgi:hypothetical protein